MKQYLHVDLLSEIVTKHLTDFTAPGSYDVEKSEKKVLHSSSAYSFGTKYKEQKLDDIPGTNLKIFSYFNITLHF